MTTLVTLSGVSSNAGPLFDLYSSPNGITFTVFASGINKTVLVAGYQATVPNGTTHIKVTSVGVCTNSNVATIGVITTTTSTTTSTTTEPPVNFIEWSEPPYGYGGDPSGGFYFINGTVEIIGSPITLRAFASIPDNNGPGSFSSGFNIWLVESDPSFGSDRYVEIARPRDVNSEAYSQSLTLPAGIYNWEVNNNWFGTGGAGEGGIVWTQGE